MLDKFKEIAQDFGYGLVALTGVTVVTYGLIQLLQLLDFTKEQGVTFIFVLLGTYLVYIFGGILRLNRQK